MGVSSSATLITAPNGTPQAAVEGALTSLAGNAGNREIMMPILSAGCMAHGTATSKPGALKAIFSRCIVPQSGKVKDISVLNANTIAGETRVAIFDTGDAKAAEYTLLAQSAAKVQAGEFKWQGMGTLGELELKAGQHVLVAVMNSSTGSFTALTGIRKESAELPTGYLPCPGGALPKLLAEKTYGSLAFTTITEAELVAGGGEAETPVSVVVRIS